MIHLKPRAGLCNRMRAIDSAIGLGQALQLPVHIYWVRGKDLNCSYTRLFEPLMDLPVTIHDRRFRPLRFVITHRRLQRMRDIFGTPAQVYSASDYALLKDLDLSTIRRDKPILIESLNRFFPHLDDLTYMRPIPELVERIAERTAGFDPHTVGVHIRRTDHIKAIERSPDALFIKHMQAEIENDPEVRFYLATDSMDVKDTFRQIFGDRIITTSYQASRDTEEGVQEGLVELYALAATSKIFGSFSSSYSQTAAQIGHVTLIPVREKP